MAQTECLRIRVAVSPPHAVRLEHSANIPSKLCSHMVLDRGCPFASSHSRNSVCMGWGPRPALWKIRGNIASSILHNWLCWLWLIAQLWEDKLQSTSYCHWQPETFKGLNLNIYFDWFAHNQQFFNSCLDGHTAHLFNFLRKNKPPTILNECLSCPG